MSGNNDLKFMQRCIELALKAEGMTYPNPLVGSVIVNEGKIIGEGYHLRAGGPHAEVAAVESVIDKKLLKSSTLYVNLEPCSHFGKTPPCADLIISSRIPSVVVGTIDTSDKVSGKGISKLREAGCDVKTGVREEDCRRVNRRFFAFHEKKRPYVILKWAETSDGFIDRKRGPDDTNYAGWITGRSERILVHKWRASEQSILVGGETIRSDNPLLNVREWKGANPIRLILSGSGLLPAEDAIKNLTGTQVVFSFFPEKIRMPRSGLIKLDRDKPSAVQILDYLLTQGIQSIFIEGGAMVLSHFISLGLWDEARIFQGYQVYGEGVKAPEINGRLISETKLSNSTLRILVKKKIE